MADSLTDIIVRCSKHWTGNQSEFARHLHSEYPDRTHGAWRTAIQRALASGELEVVSRKEADWLSLLPEKTELNITDLARDMAATYGDTFSAWRGRIRRLNDEGRIVLNASEVRDDVHLFDDSGYVYVKEDDLYITPIPGRKGSIVISGTKHREMLSAYSNWDGEELSINEIARQFRMSPNLFKKYKAIHGWTHDSAPWTNEVFDEMGDDDAIEDLRQKRLDSVHHRAKEKEWEMIRKDAMKWRDFYESTYMLVHESLSVLAENYTIPRVRIGTSEVGDGVAMVLSPTDFHFGAYGWEEEVGEMYNKDIARERLLGCTQEIIDRLPYAPEEIITAVGSDYFHSEIDTPFTASGRHALDVDGTPTENFQKGCHLAVEYIDMLAQVAPVRVLNMSGNHDRAGSFGLIMFLSAWYKNTEQVTVEENMKIRHYATYGKNLFAFSHGDTVKEKRFLEVVTAEASKEWGETDYRYIFSGHVHHLKVQEMGALTHIQLPSLAGKDRWHSRNGYVGARTALAAHLFHKEDGLITTHLAPVKK